MASYLTYLCANGHMMRMRVGKKHVRNNDPSHLRLHFSWEEEWVSASARCAERTTNINQLADKVGSVNHHETH